MTLINWIRQLPEEVLYGDMALCKLYVAALITDKQSGAAESVVNHEDGSYVGKYWGKFYIAR